LRFVTDPISIIGQYKMASIENMYKLLWVLLLLTQSVFASDISGDIKSLTYKQAETYLEKSYLNPQHRGYTSKSIRFNQENKITEQGDCYKYDGEVLIISITNNDGVIVRAIPNVITEQSTCYVKLLEGKVFPKPPYAPFFDQWMFI